MMSSLHDKSRFRFQVRCRRVSLNGVHALLANGTEDQAFADRCSDRRHEARCDTAQRLGIPLANATGEPGTSPEIDSIGFHFNGVGENSLEPFSFPIDFEARGTKCKYRYSRDERGWVFEFCKTESELYDSVVVACLLVAKDHLGGQIELASDGPPSFWGFGERSEDYDPPLTGVALFERAIGFMPPLRRNFAESQVGAWAYALRLATLER